MWDERYATDEYLYGTEANAFLTSVIDRIPPGRVLCLAEGEGRNAVWLAEQGRSVTAVDASPVGLAKARQLAAARGVHIDAVVAELADYPIPADHWDGIVSIFCHIQPDLRVDLHRRCVRGLRPGHRRFSDHPERRADELRRHTRFRKQGHAGHAAADTLLRTG